MLKPKISLIIITLLMMGGCNTLSQKDISEIDPAELPDVVAFQDEFTREFMASTEEVEEGYYLFKSKTGGYTMMFPENAQMDEIFYEMPGEKYEVIQFGENKETYDYNYTVRATYDASSRASSPERIQSILSAHAKYDGNYNLINFGDRSIYTATKEYFSDDGEKIGHSLLGVVMSNSSNQSLSIAYIVNIENNMPENLKQVNDDFMKLIESIEFK